MHSLYYYHEVLHNADCYSSYKITNIINIINKINLLISCIPAAVINIFNVTFKRKMCLQITCGQKNNLVTCTHTHTNNKSNARLTFMHIIYFFKVGFCIFMIILSVAILVIPNSGSVVPSVIIFSSTLLT